MTVFQDKYTLSKGRFVEEMQLEPAFMPKCRNFASDKANIGFDTRNRNRCFGNHRFFLFV